MARPKDPQLERLWRRRLERQSSSGLSIAVFCSREGVSEASFQYWKRRLLAQPRSTPEQPPLFVPLRAGAQGHDVDGVICKNVEIELPHRVRVRFDALPDPEWLGRVVAALGELPSEEAAP